VNENADIVDVVAVGINIHTASTPG